MTLVGAGARGGGDRRPSAFAAANNLHAVGGVVLAISGGRGVALGQNKSVGDSKACARASAKSASVGSSSRDNEELSPDTFTQSVGNRSKGGGSAPKLASKDAKPDDVKLTTAKDPPPSNDEDENPPSAPPADQLKVSWTEHIDPATNAPYYTNDDTGGSTWHKP